MVLAAIIVVPAAFALGIATRREIPVVQAPLPGTVGELPAQRELWSRDDLWERSAVRTRLLKSDRDAGEFAVALVALDRIVRPDVLVYWVPGESKIQGALPDDAIFLGKFAPSNAAPLNLPGEATRQTGVLVLYSLADQEILAVSKSFSTLRRPA